MKKVFIGLGALLLASLAAIITLCLLSDTEESEGDYPDDYGVNYE